MKYQAVLGKQLQSIRTEQHQATIPEYAALLRVSTATLRRIETVSAETTLQDVLDLSSAHGNPVEHLAQLRLFAEREHCRMAGISEPAKIKPIATGSRRHDRIAENLANELHGYCESGVGRGCMEREEIAVQSGLDHGEMCTRPLRQPFSQWLTALEKMGGMNLVWPIISLGHVILSWEQNNLEDQPEVLFKQQKTDCPTLSEIIKKEKTPGRNADTETRIINS